MKINDVNPDDLLGAVKLSAHWYIFSGTVAEWILDYANYDPGFDPARSNVVFRKNLLKVDDANALQFLDAMQEYSLSLSDILTLFQKRGGSGNWPLAVVIDFDQKLYVNGFSEISLHDYIPSHWKGVEDNPLNYVPNDLKGLWDTNT